MEDDVKKNDLGGSLANMGISELISGLAVGIAKGQLELDKACMEIASFMGRSQMAFGKRADSDEPDLLSMMELGFTPNFYQFTETSIEVRVAVSSQVKTQSETSEQKQDQSSAEGTINQNEYGVNYNVNYGAGQYGVDYGMTNTQSTMATRDISVTSVDAKYASSYNYSAESSSVVKTKISPVPPPAAFEEILQEKLKERRQNRERLRWKMQVKNILTALIERSNAMLTSSTALAYSGTSPTKAKKESLSGAISSGMQKLQSDYTSLTLDHWAVISSLVDRENADNALEGSFNALQLLIDDMILENPPKTFTERVVEAKTLVADFKAGIEAIYTRLFSTAA